MKLIVQIPSFNEEQTLAETIGDIPRSIDGFNSVEVLVIDDGSTDRTSDVARAAGADHVIPHTENQGLAAAFRTGLDACLRLGADVIVNTDADNQYVGADIPKLVLPILEGRADMVVGDRQTKTVDSFSSFKKLLQRLGSSMVRRLSKTQIPDAVSGFRAFSRTAALRLNVINDFSYTIETLIQAGQKRMAVMAVPIRVNPKARPSRLFRSLPEFLYRSSATMVRSYTMYQPLKVFSAAGLFLILIGFGPVARFLYFYLRGDGAGNIQSLILGGVLITIGFIIVTVGLVADLIASNRKLLEVVLEKVRQLEIRELQPHQDSPRRRLTDVPTIERMTESRTASKTIGSFRT